MVDQEVEQVLLLLIYQEQEDQVIHLLYHLHKVMMEVLQQTVVQVTLLVQEVVQVQHARGIPLRTDAPVQEVLRVAQATAPNCSSMRADIERSQITEIEQITG